MQSYRGFDARKPVFMVFEEVKHGPVFSATDCEFACSKVRYETTYLANNQDVDQNALMSKLVCAFVVRKLRRQLLSRVDNLQVSII